MSTPATGPSSQRTAGSSRLTYQLAKRPCVVAEEPDRVGGAGGRNLSSGGPVPASPRPAGTSSATHSANGMSADPAAVRPPRWTDHGEPRASQSSSPRSSSATTRHGPDAAEPARPRRCGSRTVRPGAKRRTISRNGPGSRSGPARRRSRASSRPARVRQRTVTALPFASASPALADRRPRHPGPAGLRRLDRLAERLAPRPCAPRGRPAPRRSSRCWSASSAASTASTTSASGDRRLRAVDPPGHHRRCRRPGRAGRPRRGSGCPAARRRRPGGRTGCRRGRRAPPVRRRSRARRAAWPPPPSTPSPALTTMTCTWIGASRGGSRRPLSSPCTMIRPPIIRVEVPQEVVQACSTVPAADE